MKYRKEIDGLRAVAVIPVILFHAGFQAFSGGFVGVDVFFVISGYLITSIIISEKQNETFTLAGFYERRARRILPALVVVMFSCLPFAVLWLLPRDLTDLSQTLVAVPLFASNILFYLKSGYFESAAELKPLLHTWSLAVEEQYYLIYPVFMLLIWRLGKQAIVGILVVIGLISLAAAQWGSRVQPVATFFLLPTRGWELLIGALVAFYLFGRDLSKIERPTLNQWLSLVGMLLITYSVFAFDKHTPFPSVYGLIPTIGTALIILFATEETMVGKILGGRVLVGIGLISYSTYLWHHPLFAFARHRSLEEPSKVLLITLAAASVTLAYFSWRWVETPFRNRQRINRRYVVMLGALCCFVLVGIGLTGYFKNGFVEGLSPNEMRQFYYPDKYERALYREGTCYLTLDQAPASFSTECYPKNDVHGTLLWGDSHAAALSIGLRKLFPYLIQYTASGCPPIKDAVILWSPHCRETNDFVIREIQRIRPQSIILHADWTAYKINNITGDLSSTIKYIRSIVPSAQVTLVGGVPQWQPSLPKVMLLKGISADKETYLETPIWRELTVMDKELELVAIESGAKFVSAVDKLCVNEKCQVVTKSTKGWALTVWDYGHLTEGGSVLLVNRLLSKQLSAS